MSVNPFLRNSLPFKRRSHATLFLSLSQLEKRANRFFKNKFVLTSATVPQTFFITENSFDKL